MNFRIRFKNPLFWTQILLSIMVPILAYFGLEFQDMKSWPILWNTLFDAISNPYVVSLVIISVFNACTDPTTKGINDSDKAMKYNELK